MSAALDRLRRPKIAAKARLRRDPVEDRMMLVFPEAALVLNPAAAEILKLCDGTRSIEAIIELLCAKFEGTGRIGEDVEALLRRLIERGLVELEDAP